MVTKRGIESSPEQIKSILDLESPKSVKDIEILTGRVAALNRLISRSSERCRSFYDLHKKNKSFKLMPEHETTFEDLKTYLAIPPLLAKPKKGEPRTVYLSITEIAGILPKDKHEARALRIKASTYTIINNILLKKSQAGPYLRCLEPNKAEQGMDIVGKLPQAPGQKVFMLAMTDYFSKWIEADSYTVRGKKDKGFLCRMEYQSSNLYTRLSKSQCHTESSNKVVINCLKKKLQRRKGKWAELLPLVLWADRTTPKTSKGQIPYSLVYGCEAVIPAEIHVPNTRSSLNTVEENKLLLQDSVTLAEEFRDAAKIRIASYQQTVARSYNKNVNIRVLFL
ncbi:uncharacterized protein LOC141632077 [Silene latifolia]|uniref:uncharacterized protein LOC141632077 n=1 Tax=Silene latifolia TaxID=37657 RepID=UPI003D789793